MFAQTEIQNIKRQKEGLPGWTRTTDLGIAAADVIPFTVPRSTN